MRKFSILISVLFLFGCSHNPLKVNEHVKKEVSKEEQNVPSSTYYFVAENMMENGDYENASKAFQRAINYDKKSIYLKERYLEALYITALRAEDSIDQFKEITNIGSLYVADKFYSEKIFDLISQSYVSQNRYEDAEIYIDKALNLYHDNANFYYLKFLLSKKKDYSLLKKARKLWKNDPEKLVQIAKVYQDEGMQKELDELLEIFNNDTYNPIVLDFLVKYYVNTEDFSKIDKVLDDSIKQNVHLTGYFWDIYCSYYYSGKRDFEKIVKYDSEILQQGFVDLYWYLLDSYIYTERYDSAITLAQKILLENQDITPDAEQDLYSLLTRFFFINEEYKNSAFYFAKIMPEYEKVRKFSRIIILPNLLKFEKEDFSHYQLFIDELTKLIPKKIIDLLELNMYSFYNKPESIKAILDDIDVSVYEDEDLISFLAIDFLEIDRVDEAKSLLMKTKEKDDIPFILYAFYFQTDLKKAEQFVIDGYNQSENPSIDLCIEVASIYSKDNEIEKALKVLTDTQKRYPENSQVSNWLGYMIAENNIDSRYEEAELLLNKANELDPGKQHIYDSLAWLYFKMDNIEKTKEYLEKMLLDDIDSSVVAFHIAEIYSKLDLERRAKQYYQLTVKLNTDDDVVEQAKIILKK